MIPLEGLQNCTTAINSVSTSCQELILIFKNFIFFCAFSHSLCHAEDLTLPFDGCMDDQGYWSVILNSFFSDLCCYYLGMKKIHLILDL